MTEDSQGGSAHTGEASVNLGPLYAALLAVLWAIGHIYGVFFHTIGDPVWLTILLLLSQLWLFTGLFIVAHDTLHGTLLPNHPRLNTLIGRIILFFYAGFSFSKMKKAHHQHHATPGTVEDPDFYADNPTAFWPWYFQFFRRYFSVSQLFVVSGITIVYIWVFGATYWNTVMMWALPAILSSVQLFYFGTYLTHRHAEPFADEHNARTNNYPIWLSLLTCFHFGYHHEHHLFPHEPWWRLPARKGET